MIERREIVELDRFWDDLVAAQPSAPEANTDEQSVAEELHHLSSFEFADELFLRRLWSELAVEQEVKEQIDESGDSRRRFFLSTGRLSGHRSLRKGVTGFSRLLEAAAMIVLIFSAVFLFSGGDFTPDLNLWRFGIPLAEEKSAMVGGDSGRTGQIDTAPADGTSVQIWATGLNGNSPRLVISDGRLFAGSCQMNLSALDLGTGNVLWDLGSLAISGTPAVFGDTVLVGGEEGKFYGLDAATGTERWSFEAAGISVCSAPLIIETSVYFSDDIGNLYALDAASGEFLWQMSLPAENTSQLAESEPDCICLGVISGNSDRIFAGTESGRILAIDRRSGGIDWIAAAASHPVLGTATENGTVFVTSTNGPVEAFDSATGELRWSNDSVLVQRSRVSVSDGIVLVPRSDNGVTAFNAASGAERWSYDPLGDGVGGFTAQLLIVDDQVIMPSPLLDIAISVVDLQTGEILYEIGEGSDVGAPPSVLAMDDGVIVIAGSAGSLRALVSPI